MPLGEITIKFSGDSFLDAEGQRAALVLLGGMLVSFGFIRMSTRLMRSPKVPWWPGSIKTEGGLHIHHLVFGIVLLMLVGFLEFSIQPGSPWLEIFAAAFGVGLGLTLDEYALWLHLRDVYWAEEGRQSVDAVIFAAIIGAAVIVGAAPLGAGEGGSWALVAVTVIVNLAICVVAALKGKFASAIVGMLIPPVAWVAAIRVARPDSFWATRRYPRDGRRMALASKREQRRRRRRTRIQELIGGRPSPPEQA